ncbi:DUF3800 domain-containing protein [candidate division WOR-3 bacterium]|nr:DUF3800 domain-containing protein [candidate division WOR-3 bacterium]
MTAAKTRTSAKRRAAPGVSEVAAVRERPADQGAQEKEYVIFCDESAAGGKYYCNFYGGVIVGGSVILKVTERLNATKLAQNLFGVAKWDKVTEQYLEKYRALVHAFFAELSAGNVKVRVMFRQKAQRPRGLTSEDLELQYFKLYYQFIKNAFGLKYLPIREGGTRLRLYFDRIPDTDEKIAMFRAFLLALPKGKELARAGILLSPEDITEVETRDHVLLQCLDIVLGAMQFRLNDWHKVKLPGRNMRGKRTRAKEALYKTILAEVRQLYPGFNIGITTGSQSGPACRWTHAYRHWCFQPREFVFDRNLTKR